MTNVSSWNKSAGSNNSASPDGFPEGMEPSGVNDSAREVMAAVSRWYQDLDASLTSGGSANAYTLTTNNAHAALADMAITAFKANHANTGSATLNADGNGAKSIKKHHDQDLASGDIEVDQICVVLYDGTNFQLVSPIAQTALSGSSNISGLKLSNDTDTDHDINVTVGRCYDATLAEQMIVSSEFTKQIDAAWSVGDDAGGIDTGSVGASTLYAVWLIKRSDTGVVDMLFSLSFTSPTMPTSYDFKRLIGSVVTDGSSNIIAFTQVGDYFRYTGDVISDIADSSITEGAFETGILSAPPNSLADIYAVVANETSTSSPSNVFVRTKDAADSSASEEAWVHLKSTQNTKGIGGVGSVLVNGSSQVEYTATEGSGASSVTVRTLGFTMLTRSNP